MDAHLRDRMRGGLLRRRAAENAAAASSIPPPPAPEANLLRFALHCSVHGQPFVAERGAAIRFICCATSSQNGAAGSRSAGVRGKPRAGAATV